MVTAGRASQKFIQFSCPADTVTELLRGPRVEPFLETVSGRPPPPLYAVDSKSPMDLNGDRVLPPLSTSSSAAKTQPVDALRLHSERDQQDLASEEVLETTDCCGKEAEPYSELYIAST